MSRVDFCTHDLSDEEYSVLAQAVQIGLEGFRDLTVARTLLGKTVSGRGVPRPSFAGPRSRQVAAVDSSGVAAIYTEDLRGGRVVQSCDRIFTAARLLVWRGFEFSEHFERVDCSDLARPFHLLGGDGDAYLMLLVRLGSQTVRPVDIAELTRLSFYEFTCDWNGWFDGWF